MDGKGMELIEIVNSFKKLESLHFFRVENLFGDFELILPKLKSIFIEYSYGCFGLTLDTPALSKVKICDCFPDLNILHPESVQTILIPRNHLLAMEQFKNLKFLHCEAFAKISDTFLNSLEHLEKLHLDYDCTSNHLEQLHNQKQRYGRNDLEIYYRGLCLPAATLRDYPVRAFYSLTREGLSFIAVNY